MSRADIVRNVLLGLFAAAAAACGESGGSDPSDGGTDAIGSDGGDDEGSTSPPVTTARPDMGPEKIAPDPDAGTPTGPVTPDEVYYVARDFNTGATGYFYNSGDGALSALPEAFSYNAIFRTQQPSVTQPSGRLCVLERSGFTDVNYQSNVTCFERNAEGVWDNAWTDRGDDAALGSIVGGRMILGRRAGNFDMAVRSFTDSDWGYLPLSTFGEVIAIDLDSAEERHIPVADHGCMAPTAAVEAEDMIFTLAESEDGTGRVCVINPSTDQVESDEATPLMTSRPRMGVKAGGEILVASPGSLDDFSAPGIRAVERFDPLTWESRGVLWESIDLCAGLESCNNAYPFHISVDESLGMGAVTLIVPTGDPEIVDYHVKLFTLPDEETGTPYELGAVIFSQTKAPGSPGGIEGTRFINGADLLIAHRLGIHKYNMTTGELTEVAGVDADGRYPSQAPVVLTASGDEE